MPPNYIQWTLVRLVLQLASWRTLVPLETIHVVPLPPSSIKISSRLLHNCIVILYKICLYTLIGITWLMSRVVDDTALLCSAMCLMTSPHGNLFQEGLSDKPLPNGLYKPIPERFMYKPINKDHTPAGFIFYIPHRWVYYKPLIKWSIYKPV